MNRKILITTQRNTGDSGEGGGGENLLCDLRENLELGGLFDFLNVNI